MIVRLLTIVTVLAGLLAVGRAWELTRAPLPPLLDSTSASEATQAEGEVHPASIAPAELAQVRNLVERPPFAADRRPETEAAEAPVETPDATAASVQAVDARLLGVIRDGAERMAVLVPGSTAETVIVRQGSYIGGWKVETVEDSWVILRNGEQTAKIELFEPR